MEVTGISGLEHKQLFYCTAILSLCWCVAAAISLSWNLHHHHEEIQKLALHVARTHYHKDILYRRWNSQSQGVYALITENTPPNPHLEELQIPEISIQTPSGRNLTLINPAYMTRQVYELASKNHDIRAHLSSLDPLRPENKADTWEEQALRSFEKGTEEMSSIVKEEGHPYLRFMRPFVTEESCLPCHAQQGYKVGDIRGGISIKMPLAPFYAMAKRHLAMIWLGHSFLTIIGLAGIATGFFSLRKRIVERDHAEEKLCQAYNEIEERVAERTQELADSNTLLKKEIKNRLELSAEKRALEAQLQQARKMEAIGTLSGGIAHDFNNILTPILGYSELLEKDIPPDSQSAEHLKNIHQAALRASEMVKQILTFSRQNDHDLHPLQLQIVVQEVLKLIRASIPSTIEIKRSIDQHCGAVLANSTQVHQVVMNLCTNAYHAMQETGGVLEVNLAPATIKAGDFLTDLGLEPGPYVRLEISDSGHGMDQATLEKIFEPYFTTKKHGEGTGMGLSVVHGIVKSMAGHITATSDIGKGTTFQIHLPCLPEAPGATEAYDDNDALLLPTGKETIMMVDDEEEIVALGKQLLGSLGYQVVGFVDSNAALAAFRHQNEDFDLVITDMTMPDMTGTELAKQLLAIRPDIPIILCSGFSAAVDKQKAKTIGIRDYILKPFRQKKLARVVRTVLDQD